MLLPALLSVLLASSAPQEDLETAAGAALRAAEEQAARGNYQVAYQRYLNIAHHYAGTAAAAVAQRRSAPNALLGWAELLRGGPSENRIDVVLMGDGYLLKKQESFDRMVEIVPELFARNPVLGEYLSYFNIIRANLRSADDKVGGFGREADTALKGRASAASSGQVAVDHGLVRRYLDELPVHDGLALVFVKAGSHGTGGGGVATIGGRPDVHTVLHEWGHAFAGLGDEYSSDTGYRGGVGERPNLSASDDPAQVPWRHFLEAKVPHVGIHQGAGGQARGAWKPTVKGCLMDAADDYCVVCREAVVLRIYGMVDPIDSCLPEAQPFSGAAALSGAGPLEFSVMVLEPRSHDLEVRWWLLPQHVAPPEPAPRGFDGERGGRGPLEPLAAKPLAATRPQAGGVHRLALDPREHPPGRYRLVCRARDSTEVRGSDWPWVIRDPRGVLESQRGWWIEIPER